MTDGTHLRDEIQDLLDGRLSAEARQRAEAHLAACDACRQEWDALRAVQQGARRAAAAGEMPPDLADQIRASLVRADDERASATRAGTPARPRRPALAWLATAAVIALAVVAALLLRPSLSSRVASDYKAHRAGALPLQMETENAEALESYFRERSLPFRVMDLRMMNYALLGGRVHRIGDRPSTFFVYRGEGNKIVVCEMYAGGVDDLPSRAERREANGIVFHVVRRGRETLVFWQEGDVACVLVSDIPSEEVVALAVAKAMKA